MPFKSEAQRRKFLSMLDKGEITQAVFDEWDKGTDRMRLLPRLEKKAASGIKIGKVKTTKVIK